MAIISNKSTIKYWLHDNVDDQTWLIADTTTGDGTAVIEFICNLFPNTMPNVFADKCEQNGFRLYLKYLQAPLFKKLLKIASAWKLNRFDHQSIYSVLSRLYDYTYEIEQIYDARPLDHDLVVVIRYLQHHRQLLSNDENLYIDDAPQNKLMPVIKL